MTSLTTIPTWLQVTRVQDVTPAWWGALCQQHWDKFLKTGLPTPKQERWKYTDLSFIAESKKLPSSNIKEGLADEVLRYRLPHAILVVLINGQFAPALSDVSKLPANVTVCSMQDAILAHEKLIKPILTNTLELNDQPFVHLNQAGAKEGLFIYVPADCVVEAPLQLLSLATDSSDFISQSQHIIKLEKNSRLTVLEEHRSLVDSAYFVNSMTTIEVGDNSHLSHYKLQQESVLATHLAHTFLYQEQDSKVELNHFSLGGKFSRDDVVVALKARGAMCQTAGFYSLKQDNQYVDHHITVNHLAPHTHSDMLYKGVLDKKSRAVFNGRLYVAKGAEKIAAHQQNHNLLLANFAEVYSKPELEIYSDDVKCKHGATTGQLDQDALFYLQARGIAKADAVHLLLHAFAAEVTQQINHADIKAHIEKEINSLC